MNRFEFSEKCWNYYLILERDLFEYERYVSFTEDNMRTYSNELIKQFQTICSEIDVVCKMICIHFGKKGCKNIDDYAGVINTHWPQLVDSKIILCVTKKEFVPWQGWERKNSPSWWKDYNLVKHHRAESDNYKKANLGNALLALAALYVLETYLYKEIVKVENPKLDYFERPLDSNYHFQFLDWDKDIIMRYGMIVELE